MFHRPKVSRSILALMCAMSFIMYLNRVNLSAAAGLIRDDLHRCMPHMPCRRHDTQMQCSEVSVVLTASSHGVCGSSPSVASSGAFSMRMGSFHK
jgi:hypothetical protein